MTRESTTEEHMLEGPDGPEVCIECEGLASGRNLRDLLVRLVQALSRDSEIGALLKIIEPRLSIPFILAELESFRSALLPNIRERLRVSVQGLGNLPEDAEGVMFIQQERRISSSEPGARQGITLPQPDKQSEVFRVLLRQWFLGLGPVTSAWLEEDAVQCNYRTVAAALKQLSPVVRRRTDRRIELKCFAEKAWRTFLALAPKIRSTKSYVDRSGQPRSVESLVRRLTRLNRTDIAIAGVLGAKRYYPDLDIVGAPRLDLCVHACGSIVDLGFVRQLDPALEQSNDPTEPCRLALHFVRRRASFFEEEDGHTWADPVECLADLFEMRLGAQASRFLDFLSSQAESLSGIS